MKKSWIVLSMGVIIQAVLGGIYAWSTFTPYLVSSYGLDYAQSGFIFGSTIAVFTIAMVFAGPLLISWGPRVIVRISAILFMTGYSGASLTGGNYILLLLSIGGIAGAGIGFGYVCPLSVGMKWFPDKKGLVTGISVAGFGGGSIVLSVVANHFLKASVDVLAFFRWYGLVSGFLLFLISFYFDLPPLDSTSKPHNPNTASPYQVIFTKTFGLITFGMFAGTFAGLIVIGNLIPLLRQAGLTETQALASMSLFALGNVTGRILWGVIFDKIKDRTIPLSLFTIFCASLLLLWSFPVWVTFGIVFLFGFGFGANFVVYASAISKTFGSHIFPAVYPIVFLAYGFAGAVGPGFAGFLEDRTGSFHAALLCSAGLLVGTLLVTIFARKNFH
ncbi:MAG: MFS transporter [Termitinemataceae bacterium]